MLITVICLLCLLYQTYLLIKQYLEYNTVINIKFMPNIINSLPAITICYNKVYSFEKLVKRYPEYISNYENYINFTKELNKNYEENQGRNISSKNDEYNRIYQDIISNNSLGDLINLVDQNIDIQDLFDNLTLPFVKLSSPHNMSHNNEHNIIIYLKGDKNLLPDFKQYESEHGELKLKPIESIDIRRKLKCFTFFDETQIPFSKNHVSLVSIQIMVHFPRSWFPYDNNTGISIAIHSPNDIPIRDSFYKLKQNTINNIYYSKMGNIRLSNYDNCIERGDIKNYNDSKNYCLYKCLVENIKPECLGKFKSRRQHPLRRDQLSSSNKSNTTNCQNYLSYKVYARSCYDFCKEDCYQAYYFVNIEEVGKYPYSKYIKLFMLDSNGIVDINMRPNSRPNILIEHFVEITFVSLICNFGGLIGMYLGISLQSVSIDIWEMSKKLFIKFIWIKFTNNNNNLIINQYITMAHNKVETKPRQIRQAQH